MQVIHADPMYACKHTSAAVHCQQRSGDTYTPWLEPSSIWEIVAINSLCLASSVEEDVRSTHHDVIDDAASRDYVGQPTRRQ